MRTKWLSIGQIGAAFLFAAAALTSNAAFPEENYFYRLNADSLACIIAHRDAYFSAGNSPVFIVADQCPPEEAASLMDLLTNEAPDLTFSDKSELDRFLSLSKSDIECLASLSVPGDAKVVRFFPAPCRIEVEAGGS